MLRYLVIAAVLVVGTFVAVTAYHTYALRIRVQGGRATMPPKPNASQTPSRAPTRALRGDAPWALSALPECLVQVQEWTGTRRFALAHLPRGARAVTPPAVLRYGDCTIEVRDGEAFVRRGADRLRIPPIARFYRMADGIALLRSAGCAGLSCASVLRVYAVPKASP
ncbi:MAG TPA: hypothetical protein VIN40_03510 [Candidatus Tyrphobacter sp.]